MGAPKYYQKLVLFGNIKYDIFIWDFTHMVSNHAYIINKYKNGFNLVL